MGPRGFRRRGRRRGLIVGAAVGAGMATRRNANNASYQEETDTTETAGEPSVKDELMELQSLKDDNLITEEEYGTKKKQILGL